MIDKLKARMKEMSLVILNGAEELRVMKAKVEGMERTDIALRGRADELSDIIKLMEEDSA